MVILHEKLSKCQLEKDESSLYVPSQSHCAEFLVWGAVRWEAVVSRDLGTSLGLRGGFTML